MKYFSLFTGIGGFELGIEKGYENLQNILQSSQREHERKNTKRGKRRMVPEHETRLGYPVCVGFSEVDKYAIKVYQKHFPTHENYGDITAIDERRLPDFDLLCGGFPCQSFSVAGKRGGFEDTRGTLFFDIARIAKHKRPQFIFLENVKGLLSHDGGRTFNTIIFVLDELGYDLQWQVLNSKNHGVPQNRERVFIIGHIRGTTRPKVFPFTGADEQDTRNVGEDLSYALDANYAKGTNTLEKSRRQLVQIGTLRTHKDGEGFREVKSGLSPTIPARAREDGSGQPVVMIREATKQGYAEARVGDSINFAVPNSSTRRGRVGNGKAQTLDTGMQQYTLTREMRIRRLTPIECERLQGFPDNWTKDISDTQRYKTIGNAVTVNVIRDICERLL